VGVDVDGVLLEGRIDLLWERPDGTLGILDVKTDRIAMSDAAARADEYRPQLGAYALVVQQVTRKRVSIVEFVFAALGGQVVTFDEVEALVEEARGLVAGADLGVRPPGASQSGR
jgi:ATP-dependent exoDNAse (exonuclease V) beta subunit